MPPSAPILFPLHSSNPTKNPNAEKASNCWNGFPPSVVVATWKLDGIRFSNTYVFHKALNWTGVLVELGPTNSNYAQLEVNRPVDTTVHATVCGTPQTIHYYERGPTGGIWEFMPPSFILSRIFDFFSLDIEGAELEALQSLDYTRVGFGVIVVEAEADEHNPLKNMALRLTLGGAGYQYLEQESTRDPYNQWFVHPQFHTIYQDWIH